MPPRGPITASPELVFDLTCWGARSQLGTRGARGHTVGQLPSSRPCSTCPMSLFRAPLPAPPSRAAVWCGGPLHMDSSRELAGSRGPAALVHGHPALQKPLPWDGSAATTATVCVCVWSGGAGRKLIGPRLHSPWPSRMYRGRPIHVLWEGKLRIDKWPKTGVAELGGRRGP